MKDRLKHHQLLNLFLILETSYHRSLQACRLVECAAISYNPEMPPQYHAFTVYKKIFQLFNYQTRCKLCLMWISQGKIVIMEDISNIDIKTRFYIISPFLFETVQNFWIIIVPRHIPQMNNSIKIAKFDVARFNNFKTFFTLNFYHL